MLLFLITTWRLGTSPVFAASHGECIMLTVRRVIALVCVVVFLGACAWASGWFHPVYEARPNCECGQEVPWN